MMLRSLWPTHSPRHGRARPGHPRLACYTEAKKDVDARDKRGHDERTSCWLGKPRNRVKRCIDVSRRVIGADLEPDLLVTPGHDRVVEPGGENALSAQVCNHRGSTWGVAQHQWHHRMLARQRLESQLDETFAKPRGHRPQMRQ